MKIDLEKMLDVVNGTLTVNQLAKRIKEYIQENSPSKMIITIEKNKELGKYYSTIYIPEEDFYKRKKVKK